MKSLPLFKGLSWLLLLNFLVKPAWIFLIDREVQNQLGHETYGQYFSIFNLSIILLFLADAGLSNLLNRQLASQRSIPIVHFLRLKIFLSVLYILIILLAAWITGIREWPVLFYIMGIHLLTSFFVFLRSIITARQFFVADAWFSVIDKLILIILASGFIYWPAYFGSISLSLFLQVQLASTFFAVTIAFGFLLNRQEFRKTSESLKLFSILRSTLPFTIIILLMGVHYRADAFILERIRPDGAFQTGIYAMGYRLLDATNTIGYLAASFLVPFIARNQDDHPLIKNVVINTRHLLLFFGISVSSFGFVFSPWIQEVLYHSSVPYYSDVIGYCLFVLPAYLMVHIYGSILTATGRFRDFIYILLIAVCINLVMNFILIPGYGAIGAAITALTSHWFAAIACFIVVSRKMKIPVHLPSLALYLVSAIVLTLYFYFSKMVIINVWLILASAAIIVLIVLLSQAGAIKKLFVSP
jgi:O-antigen/teichoic acid export membrane protein